jgi:hypothetical protein
MILRYSTYLLGAMNRVIQLVAIFDGSGRLFYRFSLQSVRANDASQK